MKRNSSIELLRIISMIGVIILHYNNSDMGGGFKYVTDGTANQFVLYFMENMFICAVNLFVMISAYFLSMSQKRKLIKVVELFVQVIAFRIGFFVLGIVLGNGVFSLKGLVINALPVNYFMILYSALYLISPYINILLNKISKETFKKLIVLLMILFSGWTILVDLIENIRGTTFPGLSTIGLGGSQSGYSIVNFVLVYIIGAYIRIYNITMSIKKSIAGLAIILVINNITSMAEHLLGFTKIITWNYNNPMIILQATVILMLFLNVKLESSVINELARATFTCFLIHTVFLSRIFIDNMVNENVFILILHQLGVALGLYILSYGVYKLYYLCSHWFIKLITPLCNKIDVSV